MSVHSLPKPFSILLVCTGNTCRSPMAECIARKLIAEHLDVPDSELSKLGYNILSAGTGAFAGEMASPEAVITMAAYGLDLENHRANVLTPELAEQVNVIWTMSMSHLPAVRALGPLAARKASRLDPERDIPDPFGQNVVVYEDTAQAIKAALQRRIEEIFNAK